LFEVATVIRRNPNDQEESVSFSSSWPGTRGKSVIQRGGLQEYGMLTADGILDVLAKHRERIRSLGIRRIGVFGSFARGETTL